MKSRLTTWLSALLLITAVFGLPVTRIVTNRVACYQVYCEQRDEDRAELAAVAPATVHSTYRAAAIPQAFCERLLDHSLFQRPPPPSSI